jgi:hypothetical protein
MSQGPYKAVGAALEVIPRTLAQNCGANVIRTLTKLRAKHAGKANSTFGIDGNKGARCLRPPMSLHRSARMDHRPDTCTAACSAVAQGVALQGR